MNLAAPQHDRPLDAAGARFAPDSFVARQPIYDALLRVQGYELLYRAPGDEAGAAVDWNRATARVLTESLLTHGTERLTDGRRAWVNFTRDLIVNGQARVVQPSRLVVEVTEDIEPDDDVLAACRELAEDGYWLALDDVVSPDRIRAFEGLARVVKVDFRLTPPDEIIGIVDVARRNWRSRLVAEKVETWEEYELARSFGFDYTQGYFLSEPVLVPQRTVRVFAPHVVALLRVASAPDIALDDIERTIKGDLSLTHKVLRYANSAISGQIRRITSVRDAVVLLGREEMRRAAALLVIADAGVGRPHQLAVDSVLRSKFCESLAPALDAEPFDCFVAGMFSLLDALLGATMNQVVADLPISEDVRAALLRREGAAGRALALVEAYERADWPRVEALAASMALEPIEVARRYAEAVEWTSELFGGAGAI